MESLKPITGCDTDSYVQVYPLGLVSSPRPSLKITALHVSMGAGWTRLFKA